MELRSFIISEYANIRPDGIFNLVGGGIRSVNTTQIPFQFSASILLIFDCSLDEGVFGMNIQLRDSDGKKMFSVNQPLKVASRTKTHTAVFRLERLKFERIGEYSFEVFVGDKSLGSHPLTIAHKPSHSTTG